MLGTDFFLFTVFILLPVAVCARNVRTPPSPIPPNSHATVNSTKSLVTFLFSVSGFYYVTSKSFILWRNYLLLRSKQYEDLRGSKHV